MNRKKAGFFFALIVIFLSVFLLGCGNGVNGANGVNRSTEVLDNEEMDNPELGKFAKMGLTAEIELQIMQDYFKQFTSIDYPEANVNDVRIVCYYGTYNNLVVFATVYESYDAAVIYFPVIGGIQFEINGLFIIAWNNGLFYDLFEATDQGYLTTDNLIQIKKNYEEQILWFLECI